MGDGEKEIFFLGYEWGKRETGEKKELIKEEKKKQTKGTTKGSGNQPIPLRKIWIAIEKKLSGPREKEKDGKGLQ